MRRRPVFHQGSNRLGHFRVGTSQPVGDGVMGDNNFIQVTDADKPQNDGIFFRFRGESRQPLNAHPIKTVEDTLAQHFHMVLDIGAVAHMADHDLIRIGPFINEQLRLLRAMVASWVWVRRGTPVSFWALAAALKNICS